MAKKAATKTKAAAKPKKAKAEAKSAKSKTAQAKGASKADDFRGQSSDELGDKLTAMKKEQFNLRFQKATGQVEKTHRVGEVRKDIARIKTVLRTKQAQA